MSSELLPNCSSPIPAGFIPGPNLCDGVVTTASEEEGAEVIRATAGLSGGPQICMQRLKNETPAYQLRQEIARRLNVDSERVELIKGGTIVGDFDPDEFGPFQYVLKAPDEEDEQELILEDYHKICLRERKQVRERESQLRVSLLLNRSSTVTLPPSKASRSNHGEKHSAKTI